MQVVEARHSLKPSEVIFYIQDVTRQQLLSSMACNGCALIATCSGITNGDPYLRYPANQRSRYTEVELKAQANCNNL